MNQADLLSCLRLDSFIAFDFETTGLQVETDRPIEVAAILFKDGKPSDRYSTLINPMIPISDMIADITGITNEMVSSAPKESEVVDELFDFIGNSPIVAHNTPFDVSFLQAMAERHKKVAKCLESGKSQKDCMPMMGKKGMGMMKECMMKQTAKKDASK